MCGRYELSSHPAAIALAFGLPHPPDLHPRYNIAPTQPVPIVRLNASGERELAQVRWGLVPRWAKDPAIGVRMINARAETLGVKSAYRNAYARHRCLVPVNGFYEWQVTPAGKQPMHVGLEDGRPFGLAGLYERWLSADGEVLDTCTIVTTDACESLRRVHPRMPVIVSEGDYTRWLDATSPGVSDLLRPWSGAPLRAYPVSTRVNAVRNDDAQLCDTIEISASSIDRRVDEPVDEPPPAEPAEADDEEPVQASLF
ncbi:MAG: SOS response-associated peptidase [Betaproteobacteria bacterium]